MNTSVRKSEMKKWKKGDAKVEVEKNRTDRAGSEQKREGRRGRNEVSGKRSKTCSANELCVVLPTFDWLVLASFVRVKMLDTSNAECPRSKSA